MKFPAACPRDNAIYSPAAVEDIISRSVRPCQWMSAPFRYNRRPLVDCRVSCWPARSISV